MRIAAIYGNFSAPKVQEIVVARGRVLELLRPDEQGRVQTVHSTDVFGEVRAIQPFRFPGGQQDYVICGSDAGRIVILRYAADRACFQKVHQETFGRSGVRRAVPGEHVAVDPKGRACLIAALEKTKFVYVLNRDSEARLTISSPLEAHRSKTLTYDVIGLDVGFDNPVFAAIELEFGEVDEDATGEAAAAAQKHVTLYELDLGLNHVVRRASEPIDNGANRLVAVPGGGDGPGGFLIFAENFVLYRSLEGVDGAGELRAIVPRRASLPAERSLLLTAAATHRQKSMFFVLAQSEYGDLYKITLDEGARDLHVQYFDSLPPATALCVLRRGFLFAASEFGDHGLYQFRGLGGDDDPAPRASASTLAAAGDDGYAPVFFDPRPPRNPGEEVAQLYAACGRGRAQHAARAAPGLALAELAVSPLPAAATGVHTLRAAPGDEHDAYIVVSFAGATLVLGVGETVEEVPGRPGSTRACPRWACSCWPTAGCCRGHPGGLRHVRPDGRVNEWRAPGGRRVTQFAANERQALVALAGGDLLLFELGAQGALAEAEKRPLGGEACALALAPLGEGRLRAPLVAVGLVDGTLRVLGLDPAEPLKALATQAVGAAPESLLVLRAGAGDGLTLQVGLSTGLLLRTEVDEVTGALTDTRSRFLGTRAPRLAAAPLAGAPAMLALSSRPWVGYREQGRWTVVPASYGALDAAAPFASEQCPEGFVAVAGATLRVLAVERPGQAFDERRARLRYTPRALCVHPERAALVTAEADIGALGVLRRAAQAAEQQARGEAPSLDLVVGGALLKPGTGDGEEDANSNGVDGAAEANGHAVETLAPRTTDFLATLSTDQEGDVHVVTEAETPAGQVETEEGLAPAALLDQVGPALGVPGEWASCVRVLCPRTLATLDCVELSPGEAALCAAFVRFEGHPEPLLVVGVGLGLAFTPRRAAKGGAIHAYSLVDGRLARLHSTPLDGVPRALLAFRGRLLAGVDASLRLFDLGKRRLLRKSEYRLLPSPVARLAAEGGRVFVGDAAQSVICLKYRKADASFYAFADDTVPRATTSLLPLDYDSVAVGDRFGGIAALRVPPELTAAGEEDPTGGKFAAATLGAAPHKLRTEARFHVGDTVTALQRGALQPGGRETIFYATLLGALGALYPFASREDLDFFQHLELHLRAEAPPLLGRDHLAFRSAYYPVKDVIDGDLCELFVRLSPDKQRQIAAELDRTPGEVLKKLEDIRNRII
ncbi:hypothetical protein QBZ16_000837 [Prototheca wickerhamii]|uniref:Splicing factor 3B subunit 3 n=1 Tax=Prototheca wickerhamii TaxID=3111 RepID=A0AAD9IE18_PROWI|nr:hypothetical protein QBZ16_000837 [Prototheca wickerhamii]